MNNLNLVKELSQPFPDIDTISVDDIILLYNLGAPIACIVKPNNKLFVSLQIKNFFMRMHMAKVLSVDYYGSSLNSIKLVSYKKGLVVKLYCLNQEINVDLTMGQVRLAPIINQIESIVPITAGSRIFRK